MRLRRFIQEDRVQIDLPTSDEEKFDESHGSSDKPDVTGIGRPRRPKPSNSCKELDGNQAGKPETGGESDLQAVDVMLSISDRKLLYVNACKRMVHTFM